MALSVVQQKSGTAGTGSSIAVTPDAAWTDGNLIVVCIRSQGGSGAGAVSSVTGGGVSSWNNITPQSNVSTWYSNIYYGYNAGGGSTAVTVNFGGSCSKTVNACEVGGAATSSVLEGQNGANGVNGTSMNSGNVTPTAGDDVIFFNCGAFQANTTATAGPSGWTDLTGGAPTTAQPASYKIVTSVSGSYNATYGIGYNRYTVVIAGFKGASGVPNGVGNAAGTCTVVGVGKFTARITYAGMPWIRTAGSGLMPLILRNPQNDNTKYDYQKCGPSPILKFGPHDYRCYYEGVTDQNGVYTNYLMYATSSDGVTWTKYASNPVLTAGDNGTWEHGEVCPGSWFWDPYVGEFKMYYHGGNNTGPRQIGLLTSPSGLPGTWTRANSSNPVMANGGSGAWDESYVADAFVVCLGPADYRMIYKGVKVSDGASRIGYATSSDGISWSKSGSNPVLDLGSGNDLKRVEGPTFYLDELGRIHLWYVGGDTTDPAAGSWRILYAYSDNWTTWTRNQADVIRAHSSTSTDSDYTQIGDVTRLHQDDGLLFFNCMNYNQSTYGGDALGRVNGRGLYWLPCKAATQPDRPGRVFSKLSGSQEFGTVNAAGKVLNSLAWTIWSDFKMPPGNTYRELYTEYNAFNKQVYVRVKNTGVADVQFRTTTGQQLLSGSARLDDNQWHRIMFVRRATNDFELYVDGVSVATGSVTCGVDSSTMKIATGNWDSSAGVADEPAMGVMRQTVVVIGTALTPTQEAALWNGGADGGSLPPGVTATTWIKHGSGGAAGPDAAENGATYGQSLTGSIMVDAGPTLLERDWSGVGASAGSGTATGVSAALKKAVGNSAGTSTATGVSQNSTGAVGSSSGSAVVTGVSQATKAATGSSSGGASVSGVARAEKRSVGASSGAASVSGLGTAWKLALGLAAGVALVAGVSQASKVATGASAGSSVVSGVSRADKASLGASSGLASLSGVSAARKVAVGSSDGLATVSGVGSSASLGSGIGSAAGSSVVTGVSAARKASPGTASGSAIATGVSQATKRAVGASSGLATVSGVGSSEGPASGVGVGSAGGTATVAGISQARKAALGSAAGLAVVAGVGGGAAATKWPRTRHVTILGAPLGATVLGQPLDAELLP